MQCFIKIVNYKEKMRSIFTKIQSARFPTNTSQTALQCSKLIQIFRRTKIFVLFCQFQTTSQSSSKAKNVDNRFKFGSHIHTHDSEQFRVTEISRKHKIIKSNFLKTAFVGHLKIMHNMQYAIFELDLVLVVQIKFKG